MKHLISVAASLTLLWCDIAHGDSRDADPKMNLALGKPVQYAPLPDYELTAKNNTDSTDLTDGAL